MNRVSIIADQIKMHVTQSKNGIMINVGVCEEADNWRSCKYDYMWNASTCNSKCNKTS